MTSILITVLIILVIGSILMTPIGKRIFTLGKSEINSGLDKLEDPIKIFEQQILELESKLKKSVEALAQIKSIEINQKTKIKTLEDSYSEWISKANKLDQKKVTESYTESKKESFIIEALNKADNLKKEIKKQTDLLEKTTINVKKVSDTVSELKETVSESKNELITLKARAEAASTMKDVNKTMSGVDSSDIKSVMDKMKNKIEKDEALADSYSIINNESDTGKEIDEILNESNQESNNELLRKFRENKNV